MQSTTLILLLAVFAAIAFFSGRGRSLALVGGPGNGHGLHSLPGYYGYYAAIWCVLPALMLLLAWVLLEPRIIVALVIKDLPDTYRSLSSGELNLLVNNIQNLALGDVVSIDIDDSLAGAADRYNRYRELSRQLLATLALGLAALGGTFAWRRIHPTLRARNRVEAVIRWALIAASSLAILTTIGIVLSVLFEAIRFFQKVSVMDFLFGLNWSPQTAIRADQVGSSGSFGAVPLFAGTLLITSIAMIVAVPVGLMTAIYLAEYSSRRIRGIAKPLLEILAGIPTVVYGFFAALTVAPWLRSAGDTLGIEVASESAMAAGLVMGVMIIPLVSSLADDAINAVPAAMRDGALGLGSTRSETMTKVILPAALPGIVGGILLAVSRAIGETMIVVMAAGLAANLTANPFAAVTTVTVQIVTLLVGDQEFDSAKTLAAFALGLMLFVVTLILNIVGLQVVRKYREQYDQIAAMHNILTTSEKVTSGLVRRRRKEFVFRLFGMLATAFGILFLGVFFATLIAKGSSAFVQTFVKLDIELSAEVLAPDGLLDLTYADFDSLVRVALRNEFPQVSGRSQRRDLYRLVSVGAGYQLRDLLSRNPRMLGTTQSIWVPASSKVDMLIKGNIDATVDASLRPVSDRQIEWIRALQASDLLKTRFNTALFSNGDSREPELAGIKGAAMGSLYMLLVTVALSFPIGVAAAIYLEEIAPRNRWSDLVEVNINNLAAVPSIVFGLLGLAVFINYGGLPRSAPLVGGLVLTLLTLPVIIIASRAAIKAVPPSIREAALGLGASQMQVVFHHVLPLAMPGMLTGTIIGMSRALGESAPLLMIGMVAFVVDVPGSISDPATALPVQIYLWADSPERGFAERTSAAIIVLLGFLLLMNLAAVLVRKRMERKW